MADASWTAADVAKALCDALVASGKLRATPAFIREDREAKIAAVFECARLPRTARRLFCPATPVALAQCPSPGPSAAVPRWFRQPGGAKWQAASSIVLVVALPKPQPPQLAPSLTAARCLQIRWP